jgi:hypothetical protein
VPTVLPVARLCAWCCSCSCTSHSSVLLLLLGLCREPAVPEESAACVRKPNNSCKVLRLLMSCFIVTCVGTQHPSSDQQRAAPK